MRVRLYWDEMYPVPYLFTLDDEWSEVGTELEISNDLLNRYNKCREEFNLIIDELEEVETLSRKVY